MTDKDRTEKGDKEREGKDRERDDGARSSRPALLVGAGRRAKETGAVLATLSGLDPAEGEKTRAPLPQFGVGDLEELLAQRPVEGVLILESGRVPPEDIGFVRRFLERHAGWRLLVLGEDSQEARARALLSLGRAQWLPWPPDLEQLRALLGPAHPQAEPHQNGAREERAPRRPARRTTAPPSGAFDLGDLLEELLAGAALQGAGTPRYQFRSAETYLVQRERAPLLEGLAGLVELARCCAGSDGLVRAGIEPAGDALVIGIDFPLAGLAEKDLPELFERPLGPEADPELVAGVRAARQGAVLLAEAGGRVDLRRGDPGRVRCEVRLRAEAPLRAPRGPGGKPEDPFA